ncbi:MAG: hypothetical protein Hyperionvirus1_156 [Hyperionvirus sp.]|uniref:Uncharacterized protein n=1 Tax=Hyperionvirus sp. TaxID=2487770 RepID=A0A3G5A5S0_9VIRU|nr:MAG: hypothetical protein Hyperionvirus1_156 [Hyperionvirus sp.]
MTDITLGGFKIFPSATPKEMYILPVYTFKCPCDFQHYIVWSGFHHPNLFLPKYLIKFQKLINENTPYDQCLILIPHFEIKRQTTPCEHIHIYINSGSKDFYYNLRPYQRSRLKQIDEPTKNLIQAHFNQMDYLPIGTRLASFISDYWASSVYDWYSFSQRRFLTSTEIKDSVTNLPETNFLSILNENIDRFESEIKSVLHEPMPFDLIKIIYSYGYSPADIFGKLILILNSDILKYGIMIASK